MAAMSGNTKEMEREILELIGDPNEIDASLSAYRESAKRLSSDSPRMIETYPKQWIALYDGAVKAQGNTFETLMFQIDKKGLPRRELVVRFIDRNQRTMIL